MPSNDEVPRAEDLEKLAVDSLEWLTLYRDRRDGRYWEKWYPHSELHGGGPPAFRRISAEEAGRKFNLPAV